MVISDTDHQMNNYNTNHNHHVHLIPFHFSLKKDSNLLQFAANLISTTMQPYKHYYVTKRLTVHSSLSMAKSETHYYQAFRDAKSTYDQTLQTLSRKFAIASC